MEWSCERQPVKKSKSRITRAVLWASLVLPAVGFAQTPEIKLDQYEVYPSNMVDPMPVGRVDENPPFLYFQRSYADEQQHQLEKLTTLFYFRMARDADLRHPVFESGERRWSFYCPYKRLDQGTWYWQCGAAQKSSPQAIKWSDVFCFTISGRENPQNAPAYDVLEAGLLKNGHPRIECRAADVGHLMPDDPKLARQLVELAEKALRSPLPKTFMDFSKWDDPGARKSGTTRSQQASYLLDGFEQHKVMPVVRGFLLTGDQRYLQEALAAGVVLDKGYQELKAHKLAEGFVNDTYGNLINVLFDSLYNELGKEQRTALRAAVTAESRVYFETLLDDYEHAPYNEHRWQSFIRSAVLKTLVLVGETPEASEWMRYLYDLWNFRAPGAGRNDGGWFTGTGYFNASCDTLFIVPYLLSQYTGANFFDLPWYKQVGKFMCYSTLPGHPSEGFGDKAGAYEATPVFDLVRNLRYVDPENPWNHRYVLTTGKSAVRNERVSAYLQSATKWYELQLRKQHPEAVGKSTGHLKLTEQAACFPDTGYVALFSDADNLRSNTMVNFRSCPFGQNGHAHAAQNAFNLTWQGRKLFFHTGYYTSSNDPFSVPNYKHSRAHNTILADGMGMSMAHSGYGWVPRFLNGGNIAYCLGDASTAYTGEYGPYGDMLKERGIAVSPANGYGKPGVTRFRRHLVFLRPQTLLVYDELEAKQPVTWTFRLNSPETITKVADDSVAVRNGNATATAKMFTLTGARAGVTDQFFGGPAVDFQHKLPTTKNEWHADLSTASKTARERLLTVIRINPGATDPTQPLAVRAEKSGSQLQLVIDAWNICVELDAAKPSLLMASDEQTGAILTGSAAERIMFQGAKYKAPQTGTTLLLEKTGAGCKVQQAVDKLPDATTYGNLF